MVKHVAVMLLNACTQPPPLPNEAPETILRLLWIMDASSKGICSRQAGLHVLFAWSIWETSNGGLPYKMTEICCVKGSGTIYGLVAECGGSTGVRHEGGWW